MPRENWATAAPRREHTDTLALPTPTWAATTMRISTSVVPSTYPRKSATPSNRPGPTTTATCLRTAGRNAEALDSAQQALQLFEAADDRVGQAIALTDVGWYQAINSLRHALDLFREVGDRYGEASALTNLAERHRDSGDTAAAHEAWLKAQRILGELNPPASDQVRTRHHRDQAAAKARFSPRH